MERRKEGALIEGEAWGFTPGWKGGRPRRGLLEQVLIIWQPARETIRVVWVIRRAENKP